MTGRPDVYLLLAAIGVLASPRDASSAAGAKPEVLATHRFVVSFPGVGNVRAVEIRGLESETGFTLDRGGVPAPNRKLKPAQVVIVRPAQEPDEFWQWRIAILSGKQDRRTGRVRILNAEGKPVLSLVVLNAFPYKWVWPTLRARSPTSAMEEIHLVAQAVLLDGSPQPKAEPATRKTPVPIP